MKISLQLITRALFTATLFAAISPICFAAPGEKPIVLDRLPADQIASRADILKNVTGAALPDMTGGIVLRVGVAQAGETAKKTIGAAIDEAKKQLKAGTPVTIRIDAGTYREGDFLINGSDIGGKAAETPLVIEGAAGGGTILTGAESYPLARWKKIGDNLYETAWQKRIPMFDGPWGVGNPKKSRGASPRGFVSQRPRFAPVYVGCLLLRAARRQRPWRVFGARHHDFHRDSAAGKTAG